MNIEYDKAKQVLTVDGTNYLYVQEHAYHALLSSPSIEWHVHKYIEPVYLKEQTNERDQGSRAAGPAA